MKKIINQIKGLPVLLITGLAIVLSACYEKFDTDSYKPVFTIGGFSAVDEIAISNLVAYWSFDGQLDEDVTGISASNKGATIVNGFKNQAVNFDVNSKSYVTYPAGTSITDVESFTISFWVNPAFVDADGNNGIDGILGLVGLSNPQNFWGNIEWFVENGSNPDAAVVKVIMNANGKGTDIVVQNYKGLFGNWSNHTLTYDAASSKLTYFINGSTAATKTTPWTGPIEFLNSGPLVFGAVQFQTTPSLTNHGPQPWASWLTGSLDEVRFYNKALTAEEINALVVLQGKGK